MKMKWSWQLEEEDALGLLYLSSKRSHFRPFSIPQHRYYRRRYRSMVPLGRYYRLSMSGTTASFFWFLADFVQWHCRSLIPLERYYRSFQGRYYRLDLLVLSRFWSMKSLKLFGEKYATSWYCHSPVPFGQHYR